MMAEARGTLCDYWMAVGLAHPNPWIGICANPGIWVLHDGSIIYSTVSDPALARAYDADDLQSEIKIGLSPLRAAITGPWLA